MIPRARVAEALGVDPDTLPEGDLPVARLAERFMGFLRDAAERDHAEAHPEFWTFALVADLAETAPDLALDTVLACLALCATPEDAALVAAGPLDDLIATNGAAVIDRIETEAAAPRFRYALTGVRPEGSAGTPLWRRIEAARADTPGIDEGAPLP